MFSPCIVLQLYAFVSSFWGDNRLAYERADWFSSFDVFILICALVHFRLCAIGWSVMCDCGNYCIYFSCPTKHEIYPALKC